MTERIILYGSLTCPMVPPVVSLLRRASAEFDYVDILFNQEALATRDRDQPGKCQRANIGLP